MNRSKSDWWLQTCSANSVHFDKQMVEWPTQKIPETMHTNDVTLKDMPCMNIM